MRATASCLWVACAIATWLAGPTAHAQSIALRVPEVCASEESVRARLAEFGVEGVEDASLTITTSTSWAGLVRGELRVEQRGAAAVRSLEDLACEDVVGALVIAAALMLREGLHTTTPTTERPSAPDVLQLDVTERESARPPARVATPSVLRLSVGLEGRAGFGPTPGLSVAPGIVGALSLDAFVAVVRLVYWPSSDALGDGSRPLGALVRAFVGTLEAGARVGEDVGVSVTGVVEGGASISRGLGIVEARDVTSGVLDVGLAATMDGRVGLVTWFFRVDVLAALVRPTYLVGDYLAFEAPPLRGSLSVGALVSPGP